MSYLKKVEEMYNMINSGQMMDAFEKYYAENVVMEEPMTGRREGKAANREFEKNWADSIAEYHGGGVNSITSNEETGVTMVEAWIDMTNKEGQRMKMEEVAVQKWNGDQIEHERFYYNMGGNN